MPLKTFEVQVTRTTDVTISIDTDKFGEEQMAEFRKSFYDFTTLEEHAGHIAQYVVRGDEPAFLEGYGYVQYAMPWKSERLKTEEQPQPGIIINVGNEGFDIEIM